MDRIAETLQSLAEAGNLRKFPTPLSREVIDLSGNDYLDFTADTATLEEEFLDTLGGGPMRFTSAASRILSTRQDVHLALEGDLERVYEKPALLFNSGYHANVGVIGSMASLPGTVFLVDKLVHASIIDGLRISGAIFYRYRHNDMDLLHKLLEKYSPEAERIVIVTESVFSMDGDRASLASLVDFKREFPGVMLYVDEAHAFGVYGDRGLGLTTHPEIRDHVDIMIGTFGKAASSFGAFVVCSQILKKWFINTARSLIFSTALPPVNVAWSRFMLKKLMAAEDRRAQLHVISSKFRRMIMELPSIESKQKIYSTTQIVPYVTGSSHKAVELSNSLLNKGILGLAIRRPTVPPGTERIRFSLHAGLTEENLDVIKRTLQLGIDNLFL